VFVSILANGGFPRLVVCGLFLLVLFLKLRRQLVVGILFQQSHLLDDRGELVLKGKGVLVEGGSLRKADPYCHHLAIFPGSRRRRNHVFVQIRRIPGIRRDGQGNVEVGVAHPHQQSVLLYRRTSFAQLTGTVGVGYPGPQGLLARWRLGRQFEILQGVQPKGSLVVVVCDNVPVSVGVFVDSIAFCYDGLGCYRCRFRLALLRFFDPDASRSTCSLVPPIDGVIEFGAAASRTAAADRCYHDRRLELKCLRCCHHRQGGKQSLLSHISCDRVLLRRSHHIVEFFVVIVILMFVLRDWLIYGSYPVYGKSALVCDRHFLSPNPENAIDVII
jgi:hypothetical protein